MTQIVTRNANRSDRGKERAKRYRQSEKGKAASKRWQQANKEKRAAYAKVKYKIPLVKCIVDGCNEIGERHHEDYSKPLDITSLCRMHHYQRHVEKEKAYSISDS
jgi:hypothetical protein